MNRVTLAFALAVTFVGSSVHTSQAAPPAVPAHTPCLRAPLPALDDRMADRLATALITLGVRPADMESVSYAFSLWSQAYIDRRHGLSAANEMLVAEGMPPLAELQGRPDQARERKAVAAMPATRRAALYAFWSANASAVQGSGILKIVRRLSQQITEARKPAEALLIPLTTRLRRHVAQGGTLPPRSPRMPKTPLCHDDKPSFAPLHEIPKPWRPLGFSLPETTRFRVAFEANATGFTARVMGDLDCDGVESTFERTGTFDAPAFPPVETRMTRPLE